MNNKVVVTADSLGAVIAISPNNPEYGYIRIEQTSPTIDDKGWLKMQKRSALIKGKIEDLQAVDYQAGQELGGKIVIKESLTPFNENTPERDLKIAGSTGVICRVDDEPIYRQTFFTLNEHAQDELIMHTNSDEIRQVQAAQRSTTVVPSSKAKTAEEVLADL
jgi:hypothetical protein